jgi:penicillin-binding protein 1A
MRPLRRHPAVTLVCLLLVAVFVASGCSGVYRYNVTLPDVPTSAQSSEIWSADGRLITTLHGEQNREIVSLDQINPTLLCSVVAIEDERFWEHGGVDIRGLARAFVRNAEAGEVVEGGSTITQQLVDVTYRDPEAREAGGKAREIVRAIQLEREFEKEVILNRYLNIVYFGASSYGAEAASQQYFGHPASELTWGEASLIAGLIQAPSRLDPYNNPEGAQERRSLVLDNILRLSQEGNTPYCDMTQAEYEAAREEPVTPQRREEELYPAGHYVEAVKHWFLYDEDFGRFLEDHGYTNTLDAREQLLLEGGLRIDTAINLDKQALAEQAINNVLLPENTEWPVAALTAIDPTNGYVEAMVGGPDFWDPELSYAQYDFASVGRRQTGSSFKPFVLATALEQTENGTADLPPQALIDAPVAARIDLGGGRFWEPRNAADGQGYGLMTIEDATVNSVNTAYANLMMTVGPENAIEMAARLGVESPMQPFPSAVLGTNLLTTVDMATAYATFAAHGVHHAPVFVTRITLADGSVLYEAIDDPTKQGEQVITPRVADTVTAILRQVVERGTAQRNGHLAGNRPAAGKTGSTNDNYDAYFVGYTPQLVTAVWIGYPGENRPLDARTGLPIRVFGGTWPTQIWNGFMSAATYGQDIVDFAPMPAWTAPSTTSTAAQPRAVPNVVGMPLAQAREVLRQSGFVEATTAEVSTAAPDTVLRQDPAAGALHNPAIAVTLVVAARPDATVPNVVGQSQASATAALQGAGFAVSPQSQANPAGGTAPGIVWLQDPVAGGGRPPGSTITIWVQPADPAATTTTTAPVETTTTTAAPTTTTAAPTTTTASTAPPPP